MKLKNTIIAWNAPAEWDGIGSITGGARGAVKCGPFPVGDQQAWFYSFEMTTGACTSPSIGGARGLTGKAARVWLLQFFNDMVLRYDMPAVNVHNALMDVDEYREWFAQDPSHGRLALRMT